MKEYSKLKDEDIVEIVRKKDKQLYSQVIKRYEEKLLRYVNYLIGDTDKSAEVVQDTFIKAYININSFNVKKKFSSWIYRIAHNEAMNVVKKRKKYIPLEGLDFESGIDIEKEFIVKELRLDTHKCLRKMPVMYSEPLSLYYLEDKTYGEISDILRISTSAVGVRISRAKTIMKKLCQKIK